MTDHLRRRAYAVSRDHHHAPGVVAEIMFGVYPTEDDADGTQLAEMAFRWHDIAIDGGPACRLEVYADAWWALPSLQDVLPALSALVPAYDPSKPWRRTRHPSVDEVVATLSSLGFTDLAVRR